MNTKFLPVVFDFDYMNDIDHKKEQKNKIVVTVKAWQEMKKWVYEMWQTMHRMLKRVA